MRERPILFTHAMVGAIVAGRKLQTRRLINPQPDRIEEDGRGRHPFHADQPLSCRQGIVGDRLWVKERWGYYDQFFDPAAPDQGLLVYGVDGLPPRSLRRAWRQPYFMPQWASRLKLSITSLRAQRLQEITAADARAEGCPDDRLSDPLAWFRQLWNSLSAKHGLSWDANPWVWVIGFEVAECMARRRPQAFPGPVPGDGQAPTSRLE